MDSAEDERARIQAIHDDRKGYARIQREILTGVFELFAQRGLRRDGQGQLETAAALIALVCVASEKPDTRQAMETVERDAVRLFEYYSRV